MARISSSGPAKGGGGIPAAPPTDDKAIARWVGTSGDTLQNSPGTLVQDSGAIQSAGFITNRNVTTTITVSSGYTWIAPALVIKPSGAVILMPDAQLIIL